MKLGKTAWYVLGIGIIVIALGSLYMLYRGQVAEQEELNNSLSLAQATLPKLAADRANLESTLTELEDKLAQATSRLKTAKAAFPTASVESIEVDELLFQIADTWDLDITSLTASGPDDEDIAVEVEDIEVEGVTYSVTSFTVAVKGKAPKSVFKTEEEYKAYIDKAVDDILDFINTIVTHEDFTTATVEIVNITVPEPLTEEEKEDLTEEQIERREGTEVPSATIQLIIYSYRGE